MGIYGRFLAVDLDVTVRLGCFHLGSVGVDPGERGRDFALDSSDYRRIVIFLAADTGHNGLKLRDCRIHRGSVIRMILNPVGNLCQGIQTVLSILRNELRGQFLAGDGTDALAGIRTHKGGHIGGRRLAVEHGFQRGIKIALRYLRLICQSGQSLDRHIDIVDSQCSVGSTSGN